MSRAYACACSWPAPATAPLRCKHRQKMIAGRHSYRWLKWPPVNASCMRTLFLAIGVTLAGPAFAREPVIVDLRCLTTGETKPIQLEWRTFFEPESKWSSAYVKYKDAKQVIPLVRRSSEATQKPVGRPWEFTTLWLEIVDGQVSGEYEITSQGVNIYGFVYKNTRTGKTVSFFQDNEAFQESECKWH